MALIKTLSYKRTDSSGSVVEKGTWQLTGGDTFGTLTTDKTPRSGASIGEIELFSFSSDNDNSVAPAQDGIGSDQIKITSAANDSGKYCLRGKAI